jgi:hypothetical protein
MLAGPSTSLLFRRRPGDDAPGLARARAAGARLSELTIFVLIPLIVPAILVVRNWQRPKYVHDGSLYDINTMWQAWHKVIEGVSPYPFVYPAPAAVLFAPLGALPWRFGVYAFWILVLVAVYLTFRLCGVRDWRCYGLALLSMPLLASLFVGSISPLLMLAAACAWRYRDTRYGPALAIAFVVGTKLFLWPLGVWLLATRRYRSAAASIVATVGLVLGSWAVIGFAGLRAYPGHLGGIASLEEYKSYSIGAFAHGLGLGAGASRVVTMSATALALAVIVLVARQRDGDRRAFVAALGAALLITPIVWPHYYVLLFVPVALASTRLSAFWLLPLLYWLLPGQESHGSPAVIALSVCITVGILVATGVGGSRQRGVGSRWTWWHEAASRNRFRVAPKLPTG